MRKKTGRKKQFAFPRSMLIFTIISFHSSMNMKDAQVSRIRLDSLHYYDFIVIVIVSSNGMKSSHV